MLRRRFTPTADADELNLIGIMNLFMVLIPFLLMGAAFFHIGVISTSLPTHTPDRSDVPQEPRAVTVNLVIRPDGIDLTAAGDGVDPDVLAGLSASWPLRADGYDRAALQGHLVELKQAYPDSKTLVVLPHDGLDYDQLVRILDVCRELEVPGSGGGEPKHAELFPVVVFSRFIAPEEEPRPEDDPGEVLDMDPMDTAAPSGQEDSP